MDKIKEAFEKKYPMPLVLEYDENKKEYKEDIRSPMSAMTMTIYNAKYEVYKSRDAEIKEYQKQLDGYIHQYNFDGLTIKNLKESLVMITKRDDWTSGECRHYAKTILEATDE